jgi:Uma2 family endonuclease
MTYDKYSLLPDDGKRYQVIEGELIASLSPNFRHQDTVWRLGNRLRSYADAQSLGIVIGAPMDVIHEPQTIVQPDLLFIRHENFGIIGDIIKGAPDLCIEVLSPSTGLHDRHTKKSVYARCAVREYWIVDPIRESVAIYDLNEGAYILRAEASGDTFVASRVLTGFETPARTIFT